MLSVNPLFSRPRSPLACEPMTPRNATLSTTFDSISHHPLGFELLVKVVEDATGAGSISRGYLLASITRRCQTETAF